MKTVLGAEAEGTEVTERLGRPRWVLCDGQLRNVSDFTDLPSKKRPVVVCPVCEEVVTLKLGKLKVHHYAHRKEANCASSSPEGALHLNVKSHFYNELTNATERNLYVEQSCCDHLLHRERARRNKGWVGNIFFEDPGAPVPTSRSVWARDWDEVKVEFRMASFRPDLALLKNEEVLAVLEVFMTHAIEDKKINYLAKINVPWLEIDAHQERVENWTPGEPIPTLGELAPGLPSFRCEKCSALADILGSQHIERLRMAPVLAAEKEREDEERRLLFYRDNHTENYAYQVVNLLWKGGKVTETWFLVKRRINGGKWTDCWVQNSFGDIICSRTAESGEELSNRVLHLMKRAVEERLLKEELRGAVIEVVQGWEKSHDHDFYPARTRTRKFHNPVSQTWGDTETTEVRPPTRQERKLMAQAEKMRAEAKEIDQVVEGIHQAQNDEERCRLMESLLDFPGKSPGLEEVVFAILRSQNHSEEVKDCAARVLKQLIAR